MKATQGHVIVETDKPSATTEGGIVLPDATRDQNRVQEGSLVDVAPGMVVWSESKGTFVEHYGGLQVGQRVRYNSYSGELFERHGKEFTVLTHAEILAVL